MLYGMIRPLPAGLPCPQCSADMDYPNRTARERGLVTCRACGLELDVQAVRAKWEQAAAEAPSGKLLVTPRPAPARDGFRPESTRDPMMVGAGLLLIAAGLWLFRGLGRR
jgi:hypothetical protein